MILMNIYLYLIAVTTIRTLNIRCFFSPFGKYIIFACAQKKKKNPFSNFLDNCIDFVFVIIYFQLRNFHFYCKVYNTCVVLHNTCTYRIYLTEN